jgi:hypothetical protein
MINMKKIFLIALMLTVSVIGTQAKSWKVGPSSVGGMDFASINEAMSKVSVGDTLYLDQNYNESNEQTVTKRVVIIGTGYDTSFTDEQVVARLISNLNLKSINIIVKSVLLNDVFFYNDKCVVERCMINNVMTSSATAGKNSLYSCYINGHIHGYSDSNYSKYDIQNCLIITDEWNVNTVQYATSSTIKYNTFIHKGMHHVSYCCLNKITNTEISNNIILDIESNNFNSDIGCTDSGTGNSIEHNILSRTEELKYYPSNKIGFGDSSSELFTQEGNFSDYYKLAESSVARDYATDGGEVGCHGGMFGCPSGGRPQYIPYFTKVTVGSRVENGKLPVSVTIKIQDE